jgi:hypothetical protein
MYRLTAGEGLYLRQVLWPSWATRSRMLSVGPGASDEELAGLAPYPDAYPEALVVVQVAVGEDVHCALPRFHPPRRVLQVIRPRLSPSPPPGPHGPHPSPPSRPTWREEQHWVDFQNTYQRSVRFSNRMNRENDNFAELLLSRWIAREGGEINFRYLDDTEGGEVWRLLCEVATTAHNMPGRPDDSLAR